MDELLSRAHKTNGSPAGPTHSMSFRKRQNFVSVLGQGNPRCQLRSRTSGKKNYHQGG
jgi:hypothetical protein